jgi:hypothetical protein
MFIGHRQSGPAGAMIIFGEVVAQRDIAIRNIADSMPPSSMTRSMN